MAARLRRLPPRYRQYANCGYWEYLISGAIFTEPPHPIWSGAALIDPEGKLVGIGSLFVQDAEEENADTQPGNMFVPVDLLKNRSLSR